ncbi:MAG: protein kinase [Planctomycetota bacterium]|nr:protein kinase [Planctomycetota bacterium]
MNQTGVPPTANIRHGWFSLVVGLLLLLTGIVLPVAFFRQRNSAQEQARERFDLLSRSTVREVRRKLEPAARVLGDLEAQARLGNLPVGALDRLAPILVERLRTEKELTWLSYSEAATGRFAGARRLPGGTLILNTSDPAVDAGLPSEFSIGHDGEQIALPRDKKPYDPRKEEFFNLAKSKLGVVWTKPYPFNEGDYGITAALALRPREAPEPQGVFTADFYLSDLSRFLGGLDVPPSGYLYLLDGRAARIAAPETQDAKRAQPALDALLAALGEAPKNLPAGARILSLAVGDEAYLGSVECFDVEGGLRWAVAVVQPERALLGPLGSRPVYLVVALSSTTLLIGLGSLLLYRRMRKGDLPIAFTPGTTSWTGPPQALPNVSSPLTRIGRVEALAPTEALGSSRRESGPAAAIRFVFAATDVQKGTAARAVALDRPVEDLSTEPLLRLAPRVLVDDRPTPALAGIPILAKLGQGAFGAVYYGVHPRLRRAVAVKVLSFLVAAKNEEWVKRFYREAQLAASINSPHLVSVFDVNSEEGLFFLVMEYVRGPTAGEHLRASRLEPHGGMPEADALRIALAAARGLAAAHAAGVIHRDIKPDNVMLPLGPDGQPRFDEAKLTDLGIARREEKGLTMTETEVAMGTFGYMAPEQARDARKAVKASDVFSMGASLYDLLAGKPPFTGTSALSVLMDTLEKPHEPIHKLRPDVSPATALLLDRCLEKNPEHRYPDGAALAGALEVALAKTRKEAQSNS